VSYSSANIFLQNENFFLKIKLKLTYEIILIFISETFSVALCSHSRDEGQASMAAA
jgi:hypothetical protein